MRKSIFLMSLAVSSVVLLSSFVPRSKVLAATAAPEIRSVSPGKFIERGSGTISITIRGKHFRAGAKVYVGRIPATSVKVIGTTTILATVPRSTLGEGRYSVVVRNKDGQGFRSKRAVWIATPHVGAVGDMAVCGNTKIADEAVGRLFDSFDGTLLALGDNAYPTGSPLDYSSCYEPSFGRFKTRTIPAVGNHEYQTINAAGYFSYFGDRAGDPTKGYYSREIGDWHIVVINSNCTEVSGGCGTGSPQANWLIADLNANTKSCTLAAMHHPRFSTSFHGDNSDMDDIWKIFVSKNVDVVLAGHDHAYQRFAPMNENGSRQDGGTQLFVVGTGGGDHYDFLTTNTSLDFRENQSFGFLDLALHPGSYHWNFQAVPGNPLSDSGTLNCH